MTWAEFQALSNRITNGYTPTAAETAAMLEFMRQHMSLESTKDFHKVAEALKPKPKPPWWRRILSPKALRFGGYLALAYLLIAAIHDSTVGPPVINSGTGPCDTAAGVVAVSVNPSRPGPNGALKAAMDELSTLCGTSLTCATTSCATCAPDPAVQTVDIKFRLFWYTAEVTANCQCWCK